MHMSGSIWAPTHSGNPFVRKPPPPLGKIFDVLDLRLLAAGLNHHHCLVVCSRLYRTNEFSAKCLDSNVIMQVFLAFRGSKLSQKLTLRAIQFGISMSLADCLRLEYRLVSNIIDNPQEFDEGIRALLIDKDNKPRWQPPVLEKVSFPDMRFSS